VCGAADDVGLAVAVHIDGKHIGAGLAEIGGMEFPRLAFVLLRLLPPAGRADHIQPAVAVDIADAKPVREFERSRNLMAGSAWLANRVHLPKFIGILAGRKPRHLAFVLFARRLPAHDQHTPASTEEIDKERRLIAGARPNHMLFPVARFAPGIFVPMAWGAR